MLSQQEALQWVQRFLGFSIFIQSLEMLQLRKHLSNSGLWSWPIVQYDFKYFPSPLFVIFNFLLSYPNIIFVVILQLFLSLSLIIYPHFILILCLFICTLLISLRWRGSFNGGSDSLTLLCLAAVLLCAVFLSALPLANSKPSLAALWFIAIHGSLSYGLAGGVKLKERSWRNGAALRDYLQSSTYSIPASIVAISERSLTCVVASWLIIIFECSFPFLVFFSSYKTEVLIAGVLFHAVNIYLLGLNRFFYAWLATYPALYFCAQH